MINLKSLDTLKERYKDYIIAVNGDDKSVREHDLTESAIRRILKREDVLDKYIVEGNEELSLAVAGLLKSGYGYYIMGYAHKHKANRLVEGFKNKEELLHYVEWALGEYNNAFQGLEDEIKKLEEIECKLSKEQIKEKYYAQLKAQTKIYENIFDFEGKKKYCEEAEQLKTVYSEILNFEKIYEVFKPIYNEYIKMKEA